MRGWCISLRGEEKDVELYSLSFITSIVEWEARAKLPSPQAHQSWRDTVRNVRKRQGTPGPQDVLFNTRPNVWTFWFFATSHIGHIHCSWKSKKLQDAASPVPNLCFKYIPTKWHVAGPVSRGQAGLASAPWGAWKGEGQSKNQRAYYPSLGKAQLGLWVSMQLSCHLSSHQVSEE